MGCRIANSPICKIVRIVGLAALFVVCAQSVVSAQDSVEFLTGATLKGKVKQISKSDKKFDFETSIGGRAFTKTYPFGKVHAVTFNGKRYELTPRLATPTPSTGTSAGTSAGAPATRTKAEVMAVIEAAGNTPPDWFDSTPLYYPETLDLSWPIKPAFPGWNIKKNMVHYLYSAIQENPSRFKSGVKLVHHCMKQHESNKTLLRRDMKKLGMMYFTLLKDYPRAAFWYQKSHPPLNQTGGIQLAECYWRLGNKEMALDMLRGKMLHFDAITLLGKMGELEGALGVTTVYGRSNAANQAYLLYGDVLRQAGKTDEAIRYYQRVVNSKSFRNKESEDRFKGRARDSIEATRIYDQLDVSKVADGTYLANAIGYAGRVDIEVKVASGRIDSVSVTSHQEKRHYGALTDIPNVVISKQTIKGIDAVSGATVTSQAILNATAKALAKGTQ